jgi:hypothetical protein
MSNTPRGAPAESASSRRADRLRGVLDSALRRFFKSDAGSAGDHGRTGPDPVRSPVAEGVAAGVTSPLRRLRRPTRAEDAHVREWKEAWVKGAEARWAGTSFHANRYPSRSARAAAWSAGWRWADRQPDRRHAPVARFAHPLRRRTDTTSRLMRSAQAGAVGLSMLTVLGWLWQMRRRRSG